MNQSLITLSISVFAAVLLSLIPSLRADTTTGAADKLSIRQDSLPVPVGGWEKFASEIKIPRRHFTATTVVVACHVSAKGRVVEAFVIQGGDSDINEAVLAAFRRTQFSPAIVNGKPKSKKISKP